MFSPAVLLTDLIRRPSVNPMGRTDILPLLTYESRVTDYLEARIRELKVDYRRVEVQPGRDNLIAIYEPTQPATQTLLWEAHQDTVPTDGMTVDPFGAVVRDGKLFGRGACDVKAGIAMMLAAFSRLATEKPASATRIVLAFTVDEEHTFLGVQSLVAPKLAVDFAIAAEPTGLHLVTSHKGVARWSVETAGVACHSSRPDDGVNAVYRMAKVLGGIERYAAQLCRRAPHPLLGPPTLSVGRVEGGTSANTVPDFCRVELDRRTLPGESTKTAVADLDDYLRNVAKIDVPFAIGPITLDCPALPECDSPWVERLAAIAAAVAGKPIRRDAVPYGTDASTIAEAGIPAVVFGPGDIAQAHTKDEWVDLAEVDRAAEILYRLAIS
jgi:acetylornithine deacetylase